MRQPFHRILLSIPMLALYTGGEPAPVPGYQASPFAYVREDGTELYLQYAGSAMPHPAMTDEDVRVTGEPASGPDLRAAVLTWSTPVAVPISGSTSSL